MPRKGYRDPINNYYPQEFIYVYEYVDSQGNIVDEIRIKSYSKVNADYKRRKRYHPLPGYQYRYNPTKRVIIDKDYRIGKRLSDAGYLGPMKDKED
jgi:hypothetical protein